MAARYAIYYVPAATAPLYRFGASVLGYDAYSGHETSCIDGADAAQWPALTREPRVYGFHATMKPPMRLKDGVTERELADVFLTFCKDQTPVDAGKPVVRELGSFIAVVPEAPSVGLNKLAAACVTRFDGFRARMTEQELMKRLTPNLSDRQIEYLYRWGYPHVFEDFRFHMTLTGSLPVQKRTSAFKFLCEKFEQVPDTAALTIDRLAIFKQPEPGAPFIVMKEAALGRSA